MHRIKKIFIFLLVLLCWSCSNKPTPIKNCGFEKAFFSLDAFYKAQETKDDNNIKVEPYSNLAPAISFDSLKSFSQIDSLKAMACRNKQAVMFGIMPLKYYFNNDTILLSAFPFICKCCVDFFTHNRIEVSISSTNVKYYYLNSTFEMNEKILNDTLVSIFSRTFKPFFEIQHKILANAKDTIEAKKNAFGFPHFYQWYFRIEVQNDKQLKKIKEPIDNILNAYNSALQKSLIRYYKKDLCDLTPFELKLFSSYLFINFEIIKSNS